jgi:hypothetical protein
MIDINLKDASPSELPIASKLRNQNTAAGIAKMWFIHRAALESDPLGYLDQLMIQVVASKPTSANELADLLYDLVPDLHLGAARGLIKLKFRPTDAKAVLKAR